MKTVTVCIGSSCHLKGSHDVVLALQTLIKENKLDDIATVKASFCHGECAKGVSVKVNDSSVISVNKENVNSFFIEYILNDKR
jgi:NADH:ubiquinone oxidoreductase subunit E